MAGELGENGDGKCSNCPAVGGSGESAALFWANEKRAATKDAARFFNQFGGIGYRTRRPANMVSKLKDAPPIVSTVVSQPIVSQGFAGVATMILRLEVKTQITCLTPKRR